jgi:hypothetical protein
MKRELKDAARRLMKKHRKGSMLPQTRRFKPTENSPVYGAVGKVQGSKRQIDQD